MEYGDVIIKTNNKFIDFDLSIKPNYKNVYNNEEMRNILDKSKSVPYIKRTINQLYREIDNYYKIFLKINHDLLYNLLFINNEINYDFIRISIDLNNLIKILQLLIPPWRVENNAMLLKKDD